MTVLHELISGRHEEIVTRTREKATQREQRARPDRTLDLNLSLVLRQIAEVLRLSTSQSGTLAEGAAKHGSALLRKGFSVSQVVHSYGDLCQAVTEIALELVRPSGPMIFASSTAALTRRSQARSLSTNGGVTQTSLGESDTSRCARS
jgi:hypothetical protein